MKPNKVVTQSPAARCDLPSSELSSSSSSSSDSKASSSSDSGPLTERRTTNTISKWPAHLVIVRHAESKRNIWKEIATAKGELVYDGKLRDMDVPLTSKGEKQAVTTGRRLGAECKFDRAFVSPFKRTMKTARLMIDQFPYPVEIIEDERLREIDFGVLDGLTKHGIARFYPEEKERRLKLGKYHHRPPAGENYPDVALRLHSFLGTLTRETAGEWSASRIPPISWAAIPKQTARCTAFLRFLSKRDAVEHCGLTSALEWNRRRPRDTWGSPSLPSPIYPFHS